MHVYNYSKSTTASHTLFELQQTLTSLYIMVKLCSSTAVRTKNDWHRTTEYIKTLLNTTDHPFNMDANMSDFPRISDVFRE